MPGTDFFLGMAPQQTINNLDDADLIDDASNNTEMVNVVNLQF